jgi:spore coat polysaccharide biosynthesis protein SpsF
MIIAILQARMSSTRLPGKVLRPLDGAPMIVRQLERLRRARRIDRLVVATSTERSDDVLAEVCTAAPVAVFRGDLDDVLNRYIGALDAYGEDADHVVRLTADCPLCDPELIDAVIGKHLRTGADYTANTWGGRTFPKGLDADIVKTAVLREAGREAVDPYEREHVLPFIYRRPDRYALDGLKQDAEEGDLGWTVDTPDDYAFVSAVYDGLHPANPAFGSDDVRTFVRGRPNLANLGGQRRI